MTTSWEFENDSSGTESMLDTVVAETDVKNRSKLLERFAKSLMGSSFNNKKPSTEKKMK